MVKLQHLKSLESQIPGFVGKLFPKNGKFRACNARPKFISPREGSRGSSKTNPCSQIHEISPLSHPKLENVPGDPPHIEQDPSGKELGERQGRIPEFCIGIGNPLEGIWEIWDSSMHRWSQGLLGVSWSQAKLSKLMRKFDLEIFLEDLLITEIFLEDLGNFLPSHPARG